jgi:hypothetical protein
MHFDVNYDNRPILKSALTMPEAAPGPTVLAAPRTTLPAGTLTAPVVMGPLSFYLLSIKVVTDDLAVVVLASPESASKSGEFRICPVTIPHANSHPSRC